MEVEEEGVFWNNIFYPGVTGDLAHQYRIVWWAYNHPHPPLQYWLIKYTQAGIMIETWTDQNNYEAHISDWNTLDIFMGLQQYNNDRYYFGQTIELSVEQYNWIHDQDLNERHDALANFWMNVPWNAQDGFNTVILEPAGTEDTDIPPLHLPGPHPPPPCPHAAEIYKPEIKF